MIEQSADASLLESAKSYARRGWSIIPTVGKKPAVSIWKPYQTQRPDDTELKVLFDRPQIDGLAVILGAVSGGLVCRDFDRRQSYDAWAAAHPAIAGLLPTVETRRGKHVYFRGPEIFRNFNDGEYRGDVGHYCLVPNSRHPSGHIYRWLIPLPEGPIPEIDPMKVGLLPCNTEDTDTTENTASSANSQPVLSAPSVLQAIELTLPSGQGQRSRKVFELARYLKAIPELATADLTALRPVLMEWHRRALPFIRTKEFTETWSDFVQSWAHVKFPVGKGSIELAFERAAAAIPPSRATEMYADTPKAVLLVSLCRELQRIAGEHEFFLDCRTAGRLLGKDHSTVWRWLAMFTADKILAAGKKGNKATRKASAFRYLAGS